MRKLIVILFVAVSARAAEFPAFMKGSWGATIGGVKMEEHWTNANGALMLGMHRDVRPDGKTSFEFLRIEQRDGKLTYMAMPQGRTATPFPLKTLTAKRVVFENPEHDFPQRIIYWRAGAKLCARVEGTMGGKSEGEEWCWSKLP